MFNLYTQSNKNKYNCHNYCKRLIEDHIRFDNPRVEYLINQDSNISKEYLVESVKNFMWDYIFESVPTNKQSLKQFKSSINNSLNSVLSSAYKNEPQWKVCPEVFGSGEDAVQAENVMMNYNKQVNIQEIKNNYKTYLRIIRNIIEADDMSSIQKNNKALTVLYYEWIGLLQKYENQASNSIFYGLERIRIEEDMKNSKARKRLFAQYHKDGIKAEEIAYGIELGLKLASKNNSHFRNMTPDDFYINMFMMFDQLDSVKPFPDITPTSDQSLTLPPAPNPAKANRKVLYSNFKEISNIIESNNLIPDEKFSDSYLDSTESFEEWAMLGEVNEYSTQPYGGVMVNLQAMNVEHYNPLQSSIDLHQEENKLRNLTVYRRLHNQNREVSKIIQNMMESEEAWIGTRVNTYMEFQRRITSLRIRIGNLDRSTYELNLQNLKLEIDEIQEELYPQDNITTAGAQAVYEQIHQLPRNLENSPAPADPIFRQLIHQQIYNLTNEIQHILYEESVDLLAEEYLNTHNDFNSMFHQHLREASYQQGFLQIKGIPIILKIDAKGASKEESMGTRDYAILPGGLLANRFNIIKPTFINNKNKISLDVTNTQTLIRPDR